MVKLKFKSKRYLVKDYHIDDQQHGLIYCSVEEIVDTPYQLTDEISHKISQIHDYLQTVNFMYKLNISGNIVIDTLFLTTFKEAFKSNTERRHFIKSNDLLYRIDKFCEFIKSSGNILKKFVDMESVVGPGLFEDEDEDEEGPVDDLLNDEGLEIDDIGNTHENDHEEIN